MKDWREARERMEAARYEEIELQYRNGDITFGECLRRKALVPDDVREAVREAVAVSERGD